MFEHFERQRHFIEFFLKLIVFDLDFTSLLLVVAKLVLQLGDDCLVVDVDLYQPEMSFELYLVEGLLQLVSLAPFTLQDDLGPQHSHLLQQH